MPRLLEPGAYLKIEDVCAEFEVIGELKPYNVILIYLS